MGKLVSSINTYEASGYPEITKLRDIYQNPIEDIKPYRSITILALKNKANLYFVEL